MFGLEVFFHFISGQEVSMNESSGIFERGNLIYLKFVVDPLFGDKND